MRKKYLLFRIGAVVVGVVCIELVLRMLGLSFVMMQELANWKSQGKETSYRILCIGESTTAGGSNAYPAILEQLLQNQEGGVRVSVINKGIIGTTTQHIAASIDAYLEEYKPHCVIAMMGVNDPDNDSPQITQSHLDWLSKVRLVQFIRMAQEIIPPYIRVLMNNESSEAQDDMSSDSQQLYEKAVAYRLEGKRAFARALLKEGLDKDADNGDLLAELGAIERWEGNIDEAKKLLTHAVAVAPRNVQALYELSELCGDTEEATRLREQMVFLSPMHMRGYVLLTESYLRLHKYAQAEAMLSKGLREMMGSDELWGALAIVHLEQGKDAEAKDCFFISNKLREEVGNSVTEEYYQIIEDKVHKAGSQFVAMQYPMRNTSSLEQIVVHPKTVVISNEHSFKDGVAQEGYFSYFFDLWGGDFGHCNRKGNTLIAQNLIAKGIKKLLP